MKVGIIGGGIAGLTAAYELAKEGYRVFLFEKEAELGGQAGTFPIEGTRLEKFYHHLFTTDRSIVELIEELGLRDSLDWLESKVGFFHKGRIYDFVSPLDLLRFKPLSLLDRLRLGFVTLFLQAYSNWHRLEKVTAKEWMERYAGKRVHDVIWEPLLRAKFGEKADEISMAWLWGKLKVRRSLKGRGIQKEFLGYMKGSFQLIIDELARRIEGMGGRIEINAPAERVLVEGGKVKGLRIKDSGFEIRKFDVIIATVPSPVFLKIVPELSGEYAALLRGVRYQAALCLVLKTKQPLSHIYWLNISDRDIPFVAVIEHTNYISPDVYGGKHILYISNYLHQDSPLLALSEEELLRLYLPGIKRINPLFGPDWVEDTWLFRDDSAQPIITCNYSQRIPDHRTPVKGLYLANTTQIYPADRGINYSVELGRKVARMVVLDSKERNSTS